GGFSRQKVDRPNDRSSAARAGQDGGRRNGIGKESGPLGNRKTAASAWRRSEDQRFVGANHDGANPAIRGRRSRRPAALRAGGAARIRDVLRGRRQNRADVANRWPGGRSRERQGPGLRAVHGAERGLYIAEKDRGDSRAESG